MKFWMCWVSFFCATFSLMTADASAGSSKKSDWIRVNLASYPRSGNGWVRHMVEAATDMVTGVVYQQEVGNLDPFPWGGYAKVHGFSGQSRYPNPGEVILIKTHFPVNLVTPFSNWYADKTIRLIRNPIDSFFSNYQVHCSHCTHEKKCDPNVKYLPQKVLKQYINEWLRFEKYWDGKGAITFRYEDLLSSPTSTLKELLVTAGYTVTDADVERAIAEYPPFGSELKHLCHYSKSELKLVKKELGSYLQKYNYTF